MPQAQSQSDRVTYHLIGMSIATLLRVHDAKKVTYVASPSFSVVAARRFRYSGRASRAEVLLTVGKPNYRNRERIRAATKSGEAFPLKHLEFQRTRVARSKAKAKARSRARAHSA